MFTDDSSPHRPRLQSGNRWLAVIVVVGAVALFFNNQLRERFRRLENASRPTPVRTEPARPAPQPEQMPPTTSSWPNPVEPPVRAAPPPPARITIYLCKGYDGHAFWSNAVCSGQRAVIDRMTSVPAELPFDQQVAIARGEANEAATVYQAQLQGSPAAIGQASTLQAPECPLLNETLRQLDSWARAPHSGQEQDRIRQDRVLLMSRRAALRC